jgi:hypothetical protein
MHPPRQIYASAADRRTGRRWTRRRRTPWLPAGAVIALVLVAGELLRGVG